MSTPYEPYLLTADGTADFGALRRYEERGGWAAARRAVTEMTPAEVIGLVKAAGLRGRGGAGFPAGVKWGFVPPPDRVPGPRYLVVNADESEPGTFKDQALLETDPHLTLEGAVIAAYAIGAETIYIYIRGEMPAEARILQEAIHEAYGAGHLGAGLYDTATRMDVTVHRGAGAYICGEETALLTSLEGGRGYPRIKPPFPAFSGLFGQPTIINNVETLANVPAIVNRGVAWFRSMGTEQSPGGKIFSLSGHLKRPGNYEAPLGIGLLTLLHDPRYGAGPWQERPFKAVIPGGSSVPVLRADELDVRMDFESLQAAGTMLGSGGVIAMDESVDMVEVLYNLARFYHHESCGQCTPCREGTGWTARILRRFHENRGREEDLALLLDIADQMMGKTICPLADALAMPVKSHVTKFPDEFRRHMGGEIPRYVPPSSWAVG
ncbi:MAG: NADH-quinone oxidoreductase subunit NuoF [Planctomycetes bacterium]|nr:NADH-quinone oxidoreductase subunit NuoF [Planctomycetota bacterium]